MSAEEREAFRRHRAERVKPAYGSKGCICKYGDPGFDGREYDPDWYPEKRCPVDHRPALQETKHGPPLSTTQLVKELDDLLLEISAESTDPNLHEFARQQAEVDARRLRKLLDRHKKEGRSHAA